MRRIAATYRELGPATFLSYGLGRAIGRLADVRWRRYRLVAVPRTGMPPMPRGFDVRGLAPEEVMRLRSELELPAEAIEYRFRQQMICLGAYRGERLTGVNWLTTGSFDEDEAPLRFVLPEGAAWDTGLYIRPDDRGGRSFAALWAGTAAWLGERGLGWSMSRIADSNLASLRSHLRMDGRDLGTVATLEIGKRLWVWRNGRRCTAARPTPVNLGRPA